LLGGKINLIQVNQGYYQLKITVKDPKSNHSVERVAGFAVDLPVTSIP
jgi:hypothetical protein